MATKKFRLNFPEAAHLCRQAGDFRRCMRAQLKKSWTKTELSRTSPTKIGKRFPKKRRK